MKRNPILAEDWVEAKLRLPALVQPKIDGVRGLNMDGVLTGRSMKKHKNLFTTARFSGPLYQGFDGEMWTGESETAQNLCRLTSSALSRIKGEPLIHWSVFDLITEDTVMLPYVQRYELLHERVQCLNDPCIRIMPSTLLTSLDGVLATEQRFLLDGYEGVCIRRPDALHREGRSTVTNGDLLRIKRFSEAEALVLRVIEGAINNNEAEINELGRTERSSHQENMEPSGMVGALWVRFMDGTEGKVSAGNMDHATRRLYFEQPELIVGKIIKFKSFLHGKKDKPRFPTFVCIRSAEDMS